MDRPIVDDQLAIDPEADAVVGVRVEGVGLGEPRLEVAGPANGKGIRLDPRVRRPRTPGEIDRIIKPGKLSIAQVFIIKINAC